MKSTLLVTSALAMLYSLAHLLAVLVFWLDVHRAHQPSSRRGAWAPGVICFAAAGLVSIAAGFQVVAVLAGAGMATIIAVLAAYRTEDFRPAGTVLGVTLILEFGMWIVVAGVILGHLDVSSTTAALVWACLILRVMSIPSVALQTLVRWEVVARRRWFRPRGPMPAWEPGDWAPMVSIHIPTYTEPPELVKETLDALARLDYPNYEVVVVDNNTKDERLWRPVEEHCGRLGSRFRFLHVEGISGAKAGALNWSRPYADPRATLIAIVDADYVVDPLWLRHTVGHFENPAVGFVQCTHAYRYDKKARFARIVDSHYRLPVAADNVVRSERRSGITIGTMSIVRAAALDRAGGWAEWCVTEDSEFAIRAHALGYESVYIDRAYGWGLVPETFPLLKKQRFRWTVGPGQELWRHHRLFLPGPWAKKSSLSPSQRLRHFNYGLRTLVVGLEFLILPVGLAGVASMIWNHDTISVPVVFLLPASSVFLSRYLVRWLLYKKVIGGGARALAGSTVVIAALSAATSFAGLAAIVRRFRGFQRTDKFPQGRSIRRALVSTRLEMLLALVCLSGAAVVLTASIGTGIALYCAGIFISRGVPFMMAPVVAVLAERDLPRRGALLDTTTGMSGPGEKGITGVARQVRSSISS